jgi:hypothetical protein
MSPTPPSPTRRGVVHPLLSDRVDIIGDVHGEIDALTTLLARLGCDVARRSVERPIVFVGDLVDRGPDSVAVVLLVQELVEAGVAQLVLGNHELNLLSGSSKEGNGWFLRRERADSWHDGQVHVPFSSRESSAEELRRIEAFLRTLPVALESPELRVVHAAWTPAAIEAARSAPSLDAFVRPLPVDYPPLALDLEGAPTPAELGNPLVPVPFHAGLAAKEHAEQNSQPIKVLTSGPERPIPPGVAPRWLSGKWRLLERDPWWEHDGEQRSVVFGHYWRRRPGAEIDGKPSLFERIAPSAWFGDRGQAFCIDYSVGYRLKARHFGHDPRKNHGLAALRWPERTLVFDDEEGTRPTF